MVSNIACDLFDEKTANPVSGNKKSYSVQDKAVCGSELCVDLNQIFEDS